ncbi:MAG: urate hydroxylase PuuD [Gammaproteobacteria bacterium]
MTIIITDIAVLLLRWFHIIAAIAWVGASFYFIWLENALNRAGKQRGDNIAGHLWAVHGGGFYYVEKHKTAPLPLPSPLHWFKWEAYATWFSGMALMVVVYYANAPAMLLAENADIGSLAAAALSVAFFAAGYGCYAALCRTALINKPLMLAFIALALLAAAAEMLYALFSARAVFLHIGALIGTIMAANVLMVIIPAQKKAVAAAEKGESPSAEVIAAGLYAARRSLHNNYLALPVVLLMIAGHAPVLYDNRAATAVLILMILGLFAARHFFNCKNRGTKEWKWLYLAAVLIMAAMAAAAFSSAALTSAKGAPDFAAARAVITKHCVQCHSAAPVFVGIAVAPGGFVLDTEAQILAGRELIFSRAVLSNSMPPGNITKMTDTERAALAAWAAKEE